MPARRTITASLAAGLMLALTGCGVPLYIPKETRTATPLGPEEAEEAAADSHTPATRVPLYTEIDSRWTYEEVVDGCYDFAEQQRPNYEILGPEEGWYAEFSNFEFDKSQGALYVGEMDGEYYIWFPNLAEPGTGLWCFTDGGMIRTLDDTQFHSMLLWMFADAVAGAELLERNGHGLPEPSYPPM